MELSRLLQLVSELPKNTTLDYVRGTDECKFLDVDIEGERINSETSTGENKSWAPTYLAELAPKIIENEPFNLSGILNNKGSFRPILETILAHTREFYFVKKGTATLLVWIPSMPKKELILQEITMENIPTPSIQFNTTPQINKATLSVKLKKGFTDYFSNYLRLSTGSEEDKTYESVQKYFKIYEDKVEKPIKDKLEDFCSIFDFYNTSSLNNLFIRASKELPNLEILLFDKWPKEKEKQTLYYEPWTMIRHYKNFLNLLNSLNDIAISIQLPHSISNPPITSSQIKFNQFLAAMRTKPFLLLAGISGTGKSRIVKEMAFASCPPNLRDTNNVSPGNYCIIEVKPNWHDSTELIGYESRIGGHHYVVTPFVNFLVKAMHHPDVPFFVCLDEMNLAPVEQYFAEFLSVLESRKLNGNEIVTEPLIKKEYTSIFIKDFENAYYGQQNRTSEKTYDTQATQDVSTEYRSGIFADIKENGLRLPSNVIVIGTVNMDETTYQFSRKVIDRAMTIEMNEVHFDKIFNDSVDTLQYTDPHLGAEIFLPKYTAAKDALSHMADTDKKYLKTNIPSLLNELDNTLKTTPFRIAYRVENELIIYFTALREEKHDSAPEELLNCAIDDILMMKVLPRIEGNEDVLEDPLKGLAIFTQGKYPKASAKVLEMQERLKINHFTSFWP